MPDALSKTIPTWCCVMNRAVFGVEKAKEETKLFTPPQAVGESEHAQMEKRIDGFVQQFLVCFLRLLKCWDVVADRTKGHLQTQHPTSP